jgi:hypothetical protein
MCQKYSYSAWTTKTVLRNDFSPFTAENPNRRLQKQTFSSQKLLISSQKLLITYKNWRLIEHREYGATHKASTAAKHFTKEMQKNSPWSRSTKSKLAAHLEEETC